MVSQCAAILLLQQDRALGFCCLPMLQQQCLTLMPAHPASSASTSQVKSSSTTGLHMFQLQIASLSKEAEERAPGIAELAGAVQARQEKMAGMEDQINSVKDSMYASISKQVSPPSPHCLPACVCSTCLPACSCIILPACLCFKGIACWRAPQPHCLPACVVLVLPACLCFNHVELVACLE